MSSDRELIELEEHLRALATKEPFVGMIYDADASPSVLRLFGKRAEAAFWLLSNGHSEADRIQALSAEVEMLRDSLTGLTPENLKAIPEWMSDFHILPLDVTAGELRRAFQALKGANNG